MVKISESMGGLSRMWPKTLDDLDAELSRSLDFGYYASSHEAFAVIQEELDELWEEIKKKQSERDPSALYQGALQVAATVLKYADQAIRLWRPNSEATTP